MFYQPFNRYKILKYTTAVVLPGGKRLINLKHSSGKGVTLTTPDTAVLLGGIMGGLTVLDSP